MGSLVPGWDNAKHEPDFREMSKPQEAEVPEWLQRVRSTDSDRDAKVHHAMDVARKELKRQSLTRTSLTSSSPGTSPKSHYLSDDGYKRLSLQLNRKSSPLQGHPETHSEGVRESAEIVKEVPQERINWWQRVESSYANTKPDAEKPENYRAGNYVPQYDIAKQHIGEAA